MAVILHGLMNPLVRGPGVAVGDRVEPPATPVGRFHLRGSQCTLQGFKDEHALSSTSKNHAIN